ncbi:MAG: hypothetical protein Q8908_07075, partial [Bacteroidota bacterium]|nr:hypothetical protein [Bacteroidota bacterium]
QTDKAIHEFKFIIDQKNNLFVENAQWYLALCYLKNNQVEAAKDLFVQISNSSNSHNQEATQILKRITK